MAGVVIHTELGAEPNNSSANGRWVRKEDMHPLTNIMGRWFRDDRGKIWCYYGASSLSPSTRIKDWWFPDDSGGAVNAQGIE